MKITRIPFRRAAGKEIPFHAQNTLRLIRGGKDFFTHLVQLIDGARSSIHLQTYIFQEDETGHEVANALINAAKRKVQVYVLADGYASQSLSKKFIHAFTEAGVQFRFFEPLMRSKHFYFGRRLHHKVFVADSRYALVGGINIANHYNDFPEKPAWLDFALLAEGVVARDLCILCWKTWRGFPVRIDSSPCALNTPPANALNGQRLIRIRRNDWVRRKSQIARSYQEMFSRANDHITILSSYFLPGTLFRQNLKKAVKRGIRVKVIIAGRSDVPLAKNAERYWYDWLLRNGIEIYEYTPNILHGKLAVCDGEWFTLGSFNVNDLSTYASIELNLDVRDRELTQEIETLLQNIMQTDCLKITSEQVGGRHNLFIRFMHWVAYFLVRSVFKLFTFYYKQTE